MSEMMESATPSATEATVSAEPANQSEDTAATTDTMSEEDFQSSLDADWGIKSEEESDVATDDEEEVTEEEPEAEEEPEEEVEEQQAEEPEPTLSVNFLGSNYNLPMDEARKYAQIGMNTGRLQEKYEALKPLEPLKDALEVMAIFQNRPVQDVISDLGSMKNLRAAEIAALVEDGHDEALAEELFDSRMKEAQQKQQLEKMKRPQEKGLTRYQREQVERFAQMRPKENEDIMAGKPIPEDVLNEWRNGVDLTTAWLAHENREIAAKNKELTKEINELKKARKDAEREAKKLAKNAENKSKAPTRKKGTGGGNGSGIDIWAGWNQF